MLRADFLGARDVEKGLGLAIELENGRFAHPVALAVRIVPAKSPPLAKTVGFQPGHDHLQVARDVRAEFVQLGIVNPAARVLDVIGIIAQAAHPEQIMEELVSHPGQRIPKEDTEDDYLTFRARGRVHG